LSRAPSTTASSPVLNRPELPIFDHYDELRPSPSAAGQKRKNGNELGGARKKRRTSDEVTREKVEQQPEWPKFALTSAQGAESPGKGNYKAEPAAQKGQKGSRKATSQGKYVIPCSVCDSGRGFRRRKNGRNDLKKQKRRPTSCTQKLTRWSQTRRQL
jgi:hypothetical protein